MSTDPGTKIQREMGLDEPEGDEECKIDKLVVQSFDLLIYFVTRS